LFKVIKGVIEVGQRRVEVTSKAAHFEVVQEGAIFQTSLSRRNIGGKVSV
jgi:hypothetical protein